MSSENCYVATRPLLTVQCLFFLGQVKWLLKIIFCHFYCCSFEFPLGGGISTSTHKEVCYLEIWLNCPVKNISIISSHLLEVGRKRIVQMRKKKGPDPWTCLNLLQVVQEPSYQKKMMGGSTFQSSRRGNTTHSPILPHRLEMLFLTLVMLNKSRCHTHFWLSANQITWSRLLI